MNNPDPNIGIIPLTHGKVAIVDKAKLSVLRNFAWRAVKAQHNWYAKATIVRNGNSIDISMHRFIARTPFGMVCHHINRNSLDNREANLVNMEKKAHTTEHQMNNIQVKFAATPTNNSCLCVSEIQTHSNA